MARIRTIKPEFWTSEQIAECSPTSRLLFIGIWNFCDDHGLHPASIKRLKMEVFPSDSITAAEIETMVGELQAVQLLRAYEVENKGYWQVTGWEKHQKIEKPTYRHPLPISTVEIQKFGATSPITRREVAASSTPESNGV